MTSSTRSAASCGQPSLRACCSSRILYATQYLKMLLTYWTGLLWSFRPQPRFWSAQLSRAW